MRAENGVDAIERPRFDHHAGANGTFLGGLEQQAHFPMDFIGHAQKNARSAKQHRHVAIVAACMHDTFVFRRIGSARELGYGQRVDIASQRNAAARISLCVIRIGRRAFDGRDNAVSRNAGVFDAHRGKTPAKSICRLGLFERQLGMLMEITALSDDFLLHACRTLLDFLADFAAFLVALLFLGFSGA